MQPPQKYQPLRDEHARVAKESAPQAEKQEAPSRAPDAEQEPQPHRPEQVRGPSPGWTESQRIEDVQGAAVRYDKWLNADLTSRNTHEAEHQLQSRPSQAEHASEQEKSSGKALFAADLARAKDGGAAVNRERDTGNAPPAQGEQKDNAPAAAEKQSGKELFAADLKEATESAPAPEQGRDHGRSR